MTAESRKLKAKSRRLAKRHPSPTRRYELNLYRQGVVLVAGVDEVGRGCLAGPVLAAAVILPDDHNSLRRISGARDSKVMKPEERERLFDRIVRIAAVGVGLTSHRFIDRYGIAPAGRMAMAKAVGRLDPAPEHVLVDAFRIPLIECPQTPIIDGDALCLSIAAASIVAKVTRDRMMALAAARYPAYGFQNHKGYGTPEHHEALIKHGPCPIHRLTFSPAFASCTIGELAANGCSTQFATTVESLAPDDPGRDGGGDEAITQPPSARIQPAEVAATNSHQSSDRLVSFVAAPP